MLIMLLVIFFSASITLIYTTSNKLYKHIFIYWIGIFMLLFSAVLLIIKFGNYPQSFSLDYFLYKILIKVKLLPSALLRLHNIGYAIIMCASVGIYFSLAKKSKVNILFMIFCGILITLFLVLNDPAFKLYYYIYINYQSFLPKIDFLKNLENVFTAISISTIIFFAVLPINILLRTAKHTMLRTICNFHLTYTFTVLLFDAYVAILFLFGPLNAFSPLELDLLSIPQIEFSQSDFNHIVTFGITMVLAILMVILLFQPFKNTMFFSKKDIENQEHFFNKNINILIHSDKNAFVIIKKYALATQNDLENKEHARKLLNEIISRSEKSILQLNDVTKVLNNNSVPFEKVNIYQCLYSALQKASIPKNISVITNFDMTEPISINANVDLLTEAFYNIIDNAIFSLCTSGKEIQLYLKVLVEVRNKSLYIEFEDNGIGISRLDQRSIFKEFYSTKNSTTNLGLGLSSVKKIINLHKGMISVKSTLKKYTCFCIILPLTG